jgi:Zn-dependent protease with chaperone function
LLQLAVSRQREYLADATGAQLLGRGEPLANALETLERGAQAVPMSVNPATASLYAVNPLPRSGVANPLHDAPADRRAHPPSARTGRRLGNPLGRINPTGGRLQTRRRLEVAAWSAV